MRSMLYTERSPVFSTYRLGGPSSKNNKAFRIIVFKEWARFHPVLALRPARSVVLFRMINNYLIFFSLPLSLPLFISSLRFYRFVCLATCLSIFLFIYSSFIPSMDFFCYIFYSPFLFISFQISCLSPCLQPNKQTP
jgi:hypothetical protein